jgi:hypothetical protein
MGVMLTVERPNRRTLHYHVGTPETKSDQSVQHCDKSHWQDEEQQSRYLERVGEYRSLESTHHYVRRVAHHNTKLKGLRYR